MNWRVEHAHPLTVLSELPDQLAQACITSPPPDTTGSLLEVLAQVHRVLRDDGTLWLLPSHTTRMLLPQLLGEGGWQHALPARKQPAWNVHGLVVLAKRSDCLLDECVLAERDEPACLRRARPDARRPRRAWCVPYDRSPRPASIRALLERCVLAGTAPVACGLCGAPWRPRAGDWRTSELWRASCVHDSLDSRCLIIDPYCGTGTIGVLARIHDRSYLGIEPCQQAARIAHHRVSRRGECP